MIFFFLSFLAIPNGTVYFFLPFPSPPSCSRELVLVNVEDHNMITPSLMKLNHFSSKRKGRGGPSGW